MSGGLCWSHLACLSVCPESSPREERPASAAGGHQAHLPRPLPVRSVRPQPGDAAHPRLPRPRLPRQSLTSFCLPRSVSAVPCERLSNVPPSVCPTRTSCVLSHRKFEQQRQTDAFLKTERKTRFTDEDILHNEHYRIIFVFMSRVHVAILRIHTVYLPLAASR